MIGPETLVATAGSSFQHAADGSLILAIPVAALAGLVSFLSPCVLPLVPAYLSYVTGLSAADLAADQPATPHVSDGPGAALAVEARPIHPSGHRRGRVLLGSVLFVAGFSAVFVTFGAFFGLAGAHLEQHAVLVDRIAGAVAVVMGLAFMGWLPGFQREWRFHKELRVWLQRANAAQSVAMKDDKTAEKSEFIFFDISSWEKKPYKSSAPPATQFMTEEELASL